MCKISLIIPVYNSEQYIEKLLDSILSQNYTNFEVILVNDGSNDNSILIINKYIKKDKRIKCITIRNSGPGNARRVGFQNANGELLFFIDSDDFLPNNNVLNDINNIYSKNKFDILIFNFIRKIENQEYIVNAFFKKDVPLGMQNITMMNKNDLAGALWSKIFVREKMSNEDFCSYSNYEDYYTTYKYLNKCKNFYYTDKIFYYANRDNVNSISKNVNTKKIFETVNLLKITYQETTYKLIFSKVIFNYYTNSRRMIDKLNINKNEKKNIIKKLNELRDYFNLKVIIELKMPMKEYLKYTYYKLIDILK